MRVQSRDHQNAMVWQSLTGRSRLPASCQGAEYSRARENCHPWGKWQTPSSIYCPWENVGLLLELGSGSPWEVSVTVLWLGKLFLAFGKVVVIYGHLPTSPSRHQEVNRWRLVEWRVVLVARWSDSVIVYERWRKHLPPTNVAWIRFPALTGWVCCWLSSLLQEDFRFSAGVLRLSYFVKKQSFRFLFDLHVNVSK